MGQLLLFASLIFGVAVLSACLAAWSAWRWLRRRNEISVGRPTRPPLRWLVSPEPCARLHRRLVSALMVVRQALPSTRPRRRGENGPLEVLATEIETRAVALDHDLMLAMHLRPAPGRKLRQQITAQVDMIERLALRLATTAAPARAADVTSTVETVRGITEYLDALDAARAEIALIEQDVGLVLPL